MQHREKVNGAVAAHVEKARGRVDAGAAAEADGRGAIAAWIARKEKQSKSAKQVGKGGLTERKSGGKERKRETKKHK